MPNAAPAAAQSAQSPIMWGAWAGRTPLDKATLDAFEARAGGKPSILHWGNPWWHAGKYVPFYTSEFETIRNRGAVPLLDWGSWDYSGGLNQPNFTLAAVANGTHDAFVHQWAQSARAWGHPFFLRFDPEMNGWWLPWSEQVNNNQSGDFVRAWRHVVDIFRAEGVSNVSWVWCPNIASPRSTALSTLYPGDDYVDWTCMDGYNWGFDKGNEWQTFAQVFGGSDFNGNHNTYQEVLDLAPGKPMMIGEIGTSRNGGDAGAWVSDALKTQLPQNFPQIKALVWFNWNEEDPILNWPIENTPAVQQAFADAIASGYYDANVYANLPPGVIAPAGAGVAVAGVEQG